MTASASNSGKRAGSASISALGGPEREIRLGGVILNVALHLLVPLQPSM